MGQRRKEAFDFKHFRVKHDQCTMKVGTDAGLLGAWANVSKAKHMLDIGTGSGVVALMLAQRTGPEVHIDAVEMQAADAEQARENVAHSPWPDKVTLHHTRIQDFVSKKKYDLVVSNPPFFSNSYLPPNDARKSARHTEDLSFEELLQHVNRLLSDQGRFSVVLPFVEGTLFRQMAESRYLFFCARSLAVYAHPGKQQERWLLEFERQPQPHHHQQLFIHTMGNNWSPEYLALMKDFYLFA